MLCSIKRIKAIHELVQRRVDLQNKVLLNRGLELAAKEDFQQAANIFLQLIEDDANDAVAYNCLGVMQNRMRQFEEAEKSLCHALELNPENPDALCNMGALFISTHRLEEAKNYLEKVIQINPNYPEAHSNLGLIQMEQGLFEEAELSFRRAIKSKPNCPEIFNDLGLNQIKRGLLVEAESSFRHAIELKPDFPEAFNNLGIVQKDINRLEEAAKTIYHAIKLNPNYAEAYNSLGSVLTDAAYNEVAEKCFYRAIRLRPNYSPSYHNLGVLFIHTNRFEEAETCFCQALKLNPNNAQTEFSLATLYLLQAQYEKGWKKYDKSRIIKHSHDQPDIPRWQGENLAQKTILLYYEQGFGDTIHFVRYTYLVSKLAKRTVLLVQKPLQSLMQSSFPSLNIYGTEDIREIPSGEFDFSCPLPSLPVVFNTSQASIPQTIPYLTVCSKISEKWSKIKQLSNSTLFRVGVVWAGNPKHQNDRNRSIPIEVFTDLFAVEEVTWVSLQVGGKEKDLDKVTCKVFNYAEKINDFADTAGLITYLDLVITVDSAVAHLAGSMGKRTWLLLPFAPDWRWQIDREDTPWYPTMHLFRQCKAGDWSEVLVRVKKALSTLIQSNYKIT